MYRTDWTDHNPLIGENPFGGKLMNHPSLEVCVLLYCTPVVLVCIPLLRIEFSQAKFTLPGYILL